ncbi:unnamed protein product [Linum trigynum]|uniref:Uncharacterized protein n=1 Tax=Linum trigynum TaxID=586398 RepID=A0AAV2F599_9ROSI
MEILATEQDLNSHIGAAMSLAEEIVATKSEISDRSRDVSSIAVTTVLCRLICPPKAYLDENPAPQMAHS